MQGKKLIAAFFVILMLGCITQLTFTWKTRQIEKDAREYAEQAVPAETDPNEVEQLKRELYQQYLDELGDANQWLGNSYQQCKNLELRLGLDLQGGMSVILEVSKYDLVHDLANRSDRSKIKDALEKARTREGAGEGDFIDLFAEEFESANQGSRLAAIFSNRENRDELSDQASNADVVDYLKEKAKGGIEATLTKIEERINKFGVSQPKIVLQEATGRIVLELPGISNPKQAVDELQATAKLEFWETWTYLELAQNFQQAEGVLASLLEGESIDADPVIDDTPVAIEPDTTDNDTTTAAPGPGDTTQGSETTASTDPIVADDSLDAGNQFANPLASIMIFPAPQTQAEARTPRLASVNENDKETVMGYLNREEIKELFPQNIKFVWGNKAEEGSDNFTLYAMKLQRNSDEAPLEGDVIKKSYVDVHPQNPGAYVVQMQMNAKGAKIWKQITTELVGQGYVAVVLDDKVYSAPFIQSVISGGNSYIEGRFTFDEASSLARIIETGKLPVKVKFAGMSEVGPEMGERSIRSGFYALIIGLSLILVFMFIYYSTGGIVADIALVSNIFFVIGVLSTLKATLTLPGIAGIVLTVGMAVDANVIIFERIREELRKGKSALKSIADGYKNSYSAIIDANVTTLIVGFILQSFGMGPVKGFATVLIIGILSSMFTAILVTRLVFDRLGSKDKGVTFHQSFTKELFSNLNFNFINRRKMAYAVSGIVIVIGLVAMFTRGFELGVDFKGGRTYQIKFDQPIDADAARTKFQSELDPNAEVKTISSGNELNITTSYKIDENKPGTDSAVTAEVFAVLKDFYKEDVSLDKWNLVYKLQQQKVEATIADDVKNSAYKAIIFALIAIFLYILVRFRKWQYGVGAVVSLFHNVLVLLGVFAIFHGIMPFPMEVGEAFIAALLTVIGYSINDTVVVFDRIREFLRDRKEGDQSSVINAAINSTLSRTIITSFTTVLTMLVLFIAGPTDTMGFAFAIILGILVGTYSSILIATPIVVDLSKEEAQKNQVATPKKKGRSKVGNR